MKNETLQKTIAFYKNLLGDIFILFLSFAGGLIATYFDFFHLTNILDETFVIGIYTIICLALSFPIILSVNAIKVWLKNKPRRLKGKINIDKLRLADGMLMEPTWYECKEHSLTLINETEHDIKQCYVMLDEVAWNNFQKEWEVVAREVFDRPFKWNRDNVIDGKIDINDGDRASFVFIFHKEYYIYNSTEKRNQVNTDFYFVFSGDKHVEIGHGADIRLRISIRGKDEDAISFKPIIYFLYVHLLQPHGIPKVNVVKIERGN